MYGDSLKMNDTIEKRCLLNVNEVYLKPFVSPKSRRSPEEKGTSCMEEMMLNKENQQFEQWTSCLEANALVFV